MIEINKTFVTAIATAGIFIIIIQMCLAMPESTISIEPSNPKVSPGDTFTVNITINPDGVGIGGAQYDLYFDNNLLNATSQTQGTFLSQDGASTMEVTNTINNTLGKIDYGESRKGDPDVIGGITTPGVLATITFKAIKPGTSTLNLSNVILSNPVGGQIPDVSVINGTCDIGTTTSTPPSTPTPSPTPTSGSGDSDNGDASVTPTPTSTLLPSGKDNSNSIEEDSVTPTQTPDSTPTQTPSPSPSPTITTSPTSTASIPMSGENKRLPGFEAVFVIAGLLVTAYLILKRKEEGDR